MAFINTIQIDGITYDIETSSSDEESLTVDLEGASAGEPNPVNADTLGGRPASEYLLKSEVYPIGGIYISLNSTNPSTIFGGTWEQIQGRFLLGVSSSYPVNQTGGEETHTLTVNESPAHTHTRGTMNITGSFYGDSVSRDVNITRTGAFYDAGGIGHFGAPQDWNLPNGFKFDASRSWTGETSSSGGGQAHNNMPPYLAVYMWKRTA